jgi:hypothetical protein
MALRRIALVVLSAFCGSGCVFVQEEPVNESVNAVYEHGCVIVMEVPVDKIEAKRIASEITGLDRLLGVQITTNEVTIGGAADNTPMFLFKERIIDRPLWRVSYKVDVLERRNLEGRHKVNPHIRGFDVYVDVSAGQVLKVVSRAQPNMPENYRIGIEISNKHVASNLRQNSYFIEDSLPTVVPTVKFADLIWRGGQKIRHYEGYYFLQRNRKTNVMAPAWFVVFYGTEPLGTSGPARANKSSRRYTLAEKYKRTFEAWVYDATSGKSGYAMMVVGRNKDTFD